MWNFWTCVSFSAFHGNYWMWHLLFSFQPRSSKEKPSGVCILLFIALHGNRIWCLPHLKSSSPHPSQGPLGEKHFPHILLTCLSSGLYLHVCFQNTARYNLHNLEARHIGSVFESLHLHKNVSPFSCRHPSCSALPFQAIHRVWRAGQWQNALILHCCGWRAGWSSYSPREMLWLFLLEGREENPTSLTLRNSFGKLDDAVTCHIG